MWSLGQIDYSEIQQNLLTDQDIAAMRGSMLVESHTPVYTHLLLEYFRADHEMTAFIQLWAYEEMKHYAALRTYLEATGRIDVDELDQQLKETRRGPLSQRDYGLTRVQSFTYTMLQEQITGWFYKRFASGVREPVLAKILLNISKDEYRHCQYYLEKARQELDADRSRMKEVDEILLQFEMPGPTFVPDYKDLEKDMLRSAPVDITALKETLEKVGHLTGKLHLVKLAADRAFHRKIRDEFGVDLGLVFGR